MAWLYDGTLPNDDNTDIAGTASSVNVACGTTPATRKPHRPCGIASLTYEDTFVSRMVHRRDGHLADLHGWTMENTSTFAAIDGCGCGAAAVFDFVPSDLTITCEDGVSSTMRRHRRLFR